ncbi:DJ-1/PfpI family protein [Aquisphaera insulae]|uniref:DJ-1/PfpI family protein n=1 Tax=Aquisphaera insulae TaxID=2712864 RepID=UPI0013ED354A|nr:DJ-1/PfpI family protein [Aquisphaera insulae]
MMNRRQMLLTTTAAGGAFAGGWAARSLATAAQAAPAARAATDRPDASHAAQAEILMLTYPRFTALDLIGPQHVFSLLGPEFKTWLVWKDTNEVVSDTGVPFRPTRTFRDCGDSPAVLFIPGGTDGTLAAMADREVREFVASRGAKATFVTSVCTGSLVLGAAGLLKGYKATSHWLALDDLKKFDAEPVSERVVVDRNRVTGAGVTAGIDFALTLAARLKDEKYAKAVQLMMEYDPHPPFQSGNPGVAAPDDVNLLRAMAIPFHNELGAVVERLAK